MSRDRDLQYQPYRPSGAAAPKARGAEPPPLVWQPRTVEGSARQRAVGLSAPPAQRTQSPARPNRKVLWGRVAAALTALVVLPLLAGLAGAHASRPVEPEEPRGAVPLANVPPTDRTHITLYNGTQQPETLTAAAAALRQAGYRVSLATDLAGLTPSSFVFAVDHPDASAAAALTLGLSAPLQAASAEYPPVAEPLEPGQQGDPDQAEVIIIVGGDYRPAPVKP